MIDKIALIQSMMNQIALNPIPIFQKRVYNLPDAFQRFPSNSSDLFRDDTLIRIEIMRN